MSVYTRAHVIMRPLEESEVAQVFEKLFKFIGKNLRNVLESSASSGGGERKGKGKGNDSDETTTTKKQEALDFVSACTNKESIT